ncbi:dolichyl pyrophosphate Man9GlcNAc2 alpha-1,3-glucosyltransferase [Schistocerca gregaria]|uniref:dolichyl pyrophosphate Man9GlcNAc2 alpha-1,3-glucosyltransferase n=1 Tax=Schistocerca gregaria TaxID=7010 RepID=UPI00211F0E83|nr:dolichyl pyrophosphate Man9GlcNAc2 alpha-1,3-glucosyltransferase [Schistocerca gregaria]
MTDRVSRRVCLILVVSVAIFLRWCVSLFSYSGQNKPPMFGDYEAQRHWMEITLNLPTKEWYFNTSNNDLQYWGLDYPPLTAYHSLICGYVARYINPEFVALKVSRGYESYEHKLFMRATVVVADLLVYIPALCCYFSEKSRGQINKFNKPNSQKARHDTYVAELFLALIYPGIILIDHGHFQYNGVSLGFMVAAVAALLQSKLLVAAMAFCLALNYKQMELYHSLPFFCYMLGVCLSTKKKLLAVKKLLCIASVVIPTFILVWVPFLSNVDVILQVLRRLFPLYRGVFEDKVANVWCALNIVYKLRNVDHLIMAKICLVSTLLAVTPSCLDLLLHPEKNKFLLALINSSLAFFLFSFHVHEKSILLAAIPAILYFPIEPFPVFWFLLVSNFSMLPLILKDNVLIPFVALTIFYFMSVIVIVDIEFGCDGMRLKSDSGPVVSKSNVNQKSQTKVKLKKQLSNEKWLSYAFMASIIGCVVLTVCSIFIKPPQKYPDLFPLIVSVYSCAHFLLFFLYFMYRQISPDTHVCLKCD